MKVLTAMEEDLIAQADIDNLQGCHFSVDHCIGDS